MFHLLLLLSLGNSDYFEACFISQCWWVLLCICSLRAMRYSSGKKTSWKSKLLLRMWNIDIFDMLVDATTCLSKIFYQDRPHKVKISIIHNTFPSSRIRSQIWSQTTLFLKSPCDLKIVNSTKTFIFESFFHFLNYFWSCFVQMTAKFHGATHFVS